MIEASPSFHLCLNSGERDGWLARSLADAGATVAEVGIAEHPVGTLATCLMIVPEVPDERGDWSQVESVLEQCFAHGQAYVRSLATQEMRHGNIIALLPGDDAMGHPARPLGSALAGGVISLFRTWTLELKAGGISVNCIFGPERHDPDDVQNLTGLLLLLAGQSTPTITGQEIFAARGMDAGRLRP